MGVVEKDNLGNELSAEQSAYFRNSQVRENGKLLVCYHGTKSPGFKEFNPSNSKSQFGKYKFGKANVNYFTTDLTSAASYGDLKYEHDGNVYYVYINIENPFVVDNQSISDIRSSFNIQDRRIFEYRNSKFDSLLKDWRERALYVDPDTWDDEDADYGYEEELAFQLEEINKGLSLYNAKITYDSEWFEIRSETNNSMFGSEDVIIYAGSLFDLFFDDSNVADLRDGLLSDLTDPANMGYLNTDEIVRYVLYLNTNEGTDYDGIIIDSIVDSASMLSGYGTDVITLKSSNQIKSIYNTNPTSSGNIDCSRSIRRG